MAKVKPMVKKNDPFGKGKGHTFKDITGQKFGKLTALMPIRTRNPRGSVIVEWKCLCDCGECCKVRGAELRNGNRTQCPKCSQKDASERAKMNGIKPPGYDATKRLDGDEFLKNFNLHMAGEITRGEFAKRMGVSRATITSHVYKLMENRTLKGVFTDDDYEIKLNW